MYSVADIIGRFLSARQGCLEDGVGKLALSAAIIILVSWAILLIITIFIDRNSKVRNHLRLLREAVPAQRRHPIISCQSLSRLTRPVMTVSPLSRSTDKSENNSALGL